MVVHGYETDLIKVKPSKLGNSLSVTFKKTGLIVYVDATTDENIIHLWNSIDQKSLPPSNIYYTCGEEPEKTYTPNLWKKDDGVNRELVYPIQSADGIVQPD